jgi:5-methyltetrahydropteroyltriglutamate--homocysteine methyltransferase
MLFPTAVVGSLPRPKWLLDLLVDNQNGRVSDADLETKLDRAVGFALSMQEAAGIDVVSDGEWRRIGYFEVFAQRLGGFQTGEYATEALAPEQVPDASASAPQQWTLNEFKQALVIEPLEYSRPIVADEGRFLRGQTERLIKVALPSPHMIGQRLWHSNYSSGAYSSRREFIEAVIPILRKEIENLKQAGVDMVQFDDPWFCFFVDSNYRARFDNPQAAMAEAIDDLNRVLDGVDGIKTVLHVCRGNRERQVFAHGDYRPILPFLREAKVDQLSMEFAISEAGDVDVFAGQAWDKELALGAVDVRGPEVEPPEIIVERAERALEFFAPEQLMLTPDCGFAPTSTNAIPMDEAYLKLSSLSQAAVVLRERYN